MEREIRLQTVPRILIVDDDEDILRFMDLGLKKKGYLTLAARTGQEALHMVVEKRPDLILLDVGLPDMNGMKVCKKIKEYLGTFTPIIMVTALGQLQSKVDGMDNGADDFLSKPFVLEELVTRVRSLLRIKALYDEVKTKTVTDELTQIYNRRYFQERLEDECDRIHRYGGYISCIMLDLDYFKSINDAFGHLAGDAILIQFSNHIQQLIRKTDVFARFGGEEFVLILPNTNLKQAKAIAETIRGSVEKKTFLHDNKFIHVTVSVGLCSYPSPGIKDFRHLLRCLDDCLYHSKRTGRNKVSMFTPPPGLGPPSEINISNS